MTLILGKSVATAEQMAAYLLSVNKYPKFSRNVSVLEFCQLFLDICAKEGVRGDLSFCQSCKETANFKYGGDVKYTQNNFAGIGATGGVPGCSFSSIEEGILAQAQHLKTYATKGALNEPCVDPRRTNWFVNTKGGTAPNWEDLGGTWAVPGYSTSKYSSLVEANKAKDSYGYQIVDILNKILKFDIKEETNMVYRIANDAGHGSSTAGKRTPDGYREHWINVKCANYFDIAMKRCGIETVRIAWDDTNSTDDSDIALSTRQAQIKNAGCILSVSWHANAHGNGSTWTSGQGIETLIHSNSARVGDSRNLANKVQAQLIKGTTQKNRGVKASNLAMCNCTAMGTKASILIEIGFMTNEYEASLLKTDAFCLECAEEAARGVCEYLGVVYKANAFATTTTKSTIYRVRKTWADASSQIGAYSSLANAKAACKEGYFVFDANGNIVYPITTASTSAVPLKVTQDKKSIQTFLNTYYGTEIKNALGALLVVDGAIGNKSKLALGIAFQVELNKLGAGLTVDGKIGAKSDAAFDKYVGVLKRGMQDNIFVTLWQCVLVVHNMNPNGIDGDFGAGCATTTNGLFAKIGLTKDSSVSGADINALL